MLLVQPSAALGVVHRVGEIMTRDLQHGVGVSLVGDAMRLHVVKDGVPFWTVDLAVEPAGVIAGYFATGADRLVRQGGSGLGDAVRAEPVRLTSYLIVPAATLGGMLPIGHVFYAWPAKDAIVLMIRGNTLVFRIFQNGAKFYEVEFAPDQAERMAEFVRRAADRLAKCGASVSLSA